MSIAIPGTCRCGKTGRKSGRVEQLAVIGDRISSATDMANVAYGRMFWFRRNTFVGSYFRLSARSRSYFASPYAARTRS